jgi:hypothetical protein
MRKILSGKADGKVATSTAGWSSWLRKKESGWTEACVNGKSMLIFVCGNLETYKILTKHNFGTASGIQTILLTRHDFRFRDSPATTKTRYLLFWRWCNFCGRRWNMLVVPEYKGLLGLRFHSVYPRESKYRIIIEMVLRFTATYRWMVCSI